MLRRRCMQALWMVLATLPALASADSVQPGDWVTIAFTQQDTSRSMKLEQRFEVTGEETDRAGTRLVWLQMQVTGGIRAKLLVPAELFEREGVTQKDFFDQTERLSWAPPGGRLRTLDPEQAEEYLAGWFTFLGSDCRAPSSGLKMAGTEVIQTANGPVECLVIRSSREEVQRVEGTSWCSEEIPVAGFAKAVVEWMPAEQADSMAAESGKRHLEIKVLDFGRGPRE